MEEVIYLMSDLLWGAILIYLLSGVGIFFTAKLGFIQFRHFSHMFSVLKNSRKGDQSGISSFQALCTGLAARVGTGNMAGVAVAITTGGPGAVFWMWFIAMLGMPTAFAESTLAQLYKTRDENGCYRGGPAYYIEKGLGMRWLGMVFSMLLIVAFGLIFNAVQANSIASALSSAFGWDNLYVGLGVAALSAVVIFGGLRRIARVAELLVPLMLLIYLGLALFIVFVNLEKVPAVLSLVVESAFGLTEAAAGGVGYAISQAMINGFRRGLFSNESGMGAAPNIAASAAPSPPHPASQGYVQMLGVFIDTIVICTATVSIILLSGEYIPHSEITGIQLTQRAVSAQVGDWGSLFVAFAIFFFAFTSIIANYCYAETNILFLGRNRKRGIQVFRLLVLAMVLIGSLGALDVIWALADVSMGLMVIINLVAITLLSGIVIKLARDYNSQLRAGKEPVFNTQEYPELHSQLEKGIWDRK
ncbi:sodium:alanine symporter family protein [Vibrio sp. JC009]|uniref:alanine/glycine:cation symporter family protein n=1 Tax=Vibrio sp. JC009 TaxID=2912314 RepID=UPI0023B1D4EC|nr:sodium:alanine symporter family protein [Vibrio sp. JC009]WED22347.1 sodium:alanine symporter family protein [Vibrio sp. JC009]